MLALKIINQNNNQVINTEKVVEKIEDNTIGNDEKLEEENEITKETIEPSYDVTSIAFYKGVNTDEEPFSVINMYPGDHIQKQYVVSIAHKGPIDVNFHVVVNDKYKHLSDALWMIIECEDKKIYEGSMTNANSTYRISSTTEQTDRITYKISVGLPTSAGNEYQNKECLADFYWEAIEVDEGYLIPNTADRNVIESIYHSKFIYPILIIAILALIYWISKGEKHEE